MLVFYYSERPTVISIDPVYIPSNRCSNHNHRETFSDAKLVAVRLAIEAGNHYLQIVSISETSIKALVPPNPLNTESLQAEVL